MPDWPPLGPRHTWRTDQTWRVGPETQRSTAEQHALEARRDIGAAGEGRAAAFLAQLGYTIVERNWRNDLGELDLVAMDGNELVLIEVRTLTSAHHGVPEESVGSRKQRQLAHLAAAYVQHAKHQGEWRIDVIAIDRDGLRHIKNAVSLW